jgi:guanylate kinase
VGPSGVGKGTLIAKLTEKYEGKFGFSVSYTTRTAREGEQHGVHYFFITKEEFTKMIDNDAFIEHC